MSTVVVNYRTAQTSGVRITRGTPFGNPFPICRGRTREQSIAAFETYARRRLAEDAVFATAVWQLDGQTLLCCCKPKACHGDVLATLAAELTLTEKPK